LRMDTLWWNWPFRPQRSMMTIYWSPIGHQTRLGRWPSIRGGSSSWWCSWSLDGSCKIVSWGGARGTLFGQGTHLWDCTRHHEQRSVVASATPTGHWRRCRRFMSRRCSLSAPTSIVFLEQHDIHTNSLVGGRNTDMMVSKSLYPITHFWNHLVKFKKKYVLEYNWNLKFYVGHH
jgi:hypothetical protein